MQDASTKHSKKGVEVRHFCISLVPWRPQKFFGGVSRSAGTLGSQNLISSTKVYLIGWLVFLTSPCHENSPPSVVDVLKPVLDMNKLEFSMQNNKEKDLDRKAMLDANHLPTLINN